MNIVHIITKSKWGGAQKNVFDIACHFSGKNNVTVIAGGNGLLLQKLKDKNMRIISIPFLDRDFNFLKEIRTFFFLIKTLRKLSPDIVHLHSSKIGILGSIAARIALFGKDKQIIFTAHGWVFNELHRSQLSKFILKFISYITILLTDKTIVLSKKEYCQMIKFPFMKNRLHIIPLGIQSINFHSIDHSREKIYKKEPKLRSYSKDPWIITIAELHINKNIKTAIKAMASIPNIPYIVIGEGESRSELENFIKQQKMSDQVFLIGHMNEASRILSAGDLFILPSKKEGLPYVILEAGLAGIPIIATKVGGIPELLKESDTGFLIEPSDTTNLIQKINYILNNKPESNKIAEKFKKEIKEKYSINSMTESLKKLYTTF